MVFQPDIRPGVELASKELNDIFHGQQQGGMRYSRTTNSLVLVTDRKKLSGTSIYGDEWIDDVLHYRGTGQRGDQNLDFAGNAKLVHAQRDDTGVFVFERTKHAHYRYLGRAELAGDPYRRNEPDADDDMRLVWVFPLRLVDAGAPAAEAAVPAALAAKTPLSLLPSDAAVAVEVIAQESGITHESIQLALLRMGAGLGLDVWVARNDRGKVVDGQPFASLPRMRDTLPQQFGPSVMKVIENIDVIWLRGNGIEAAFEIEHTTSVYSGLLRMADLITMHPNFFIRLYVVAPDTREAKVLKEIARPTFEGLPVPLRDICGCITYSRLLIEAEAVKKYGSQLKPGFLHEIARFAESPEASATMA
jgi:hypothetical protein